MIRITEHWTRYSWKRGIWKHFGLSLRFNSDIEVNQLYISEVEKEHSVYGRKIYVLLYGDDCIAFHFKEGKMKDLKALLEYFKSPASQSSNTR